MKNVIEQGRIEHEKLKKLKGRMKNGEKEYRMEWMDRGKTNE